MSKKKDKISKMVEVTEKNFESVTKEGVVLLDFWAPWCAPCRMLMPMIEEIANDMDGVAVVGKVNTDEQEELTKKLGLRSIPIIIIFKDGKEQERIMGASSRETYVNAINRATVKEM